MTTVRTRIRKISSKEGFDIEVIRRGKPVKLSRNGVLNGWPYEKKSKESMTVSEFKGKFSDAYPGYECRVFDGDGHVVNGNTLLRSVRATYDD